MIELGLDSFVGTALDATGLPYGEEQRMQELLEAAELADQVGLHVFGIGEHHRPDYIASCPAVVLAAIAARTKQLRLTSAVTVLSSDDPVRVFQQFATLDLISQGRAEIIVGRGSFIESYPLFGFDLRDYDTLFTEKLELLLDLRESVHVHWSGRHRAPLTGQGVFPRPVQKKLPIRIGVGGTPASFVRAGILGLPLVIAIIGGAPAQFRPYVELYRSAWREAGHPEEALSVGIHTIGYIGETTQEAAERLYPGYEVVFGRIGRERGWRGSPRLQFDQSRGPEGSLMVGSSHDIAEKILRINADLGGIDRVTIQMDGAMVGHENLCGAIRRLGTEVAPRVNTA
jgi:probable LLM family oxidoreductase